jgi:hypothetical protein
MRNTDDKGSKKGCPQPASYHFFLFTTVNHSFFIFVIMYFLL